MSSEKKNRRELKAFFVKNAIPTEKNFADLIDAGFNQAEDGIDKPANSPLRIEASGDTKKVINFYEGFDDPRPAWGLALGRLTDPADVATASDGFAIIDGAGTARLFIDSDGNVETTGDMAIGGTMVAENVTLASGNNTNGALFFTENGDFSNALYSNSNNVDGEGASDGVRLNVTNGLEIRTGEDKTSTMSVKPGTVSIVGEQGSDEAALDIRAENTISWNGWYEAIRFSQPPGSAITHPGTKLLFGMTSTPRGFFFGEMVEDEKEYFMEILADSEMVRVPRGSVQVSSGSVHVPKGDVLVRKVKLTSDARLKRDITNLNYGLKEVTQLRPVSFNWKDTNDPHKQVGLVAQEVLPIIEEAVSPDGQGEDAHLSIAYGSLIPVLINAVKELATQREELATQIEKLATQREELATQIEELATEVGELTRNAEELEAKVN